MLQRLLAAALCAAQARAASVSHEVVAQVPENDWRGSFASPNATGEIRFKGYNITAPFPGVESDDWRFTIKVRDGLPQGASDPSRFVTGIWIEVDPPDNLVRREGNRDIIPQDPSWQVCQGFWELSNLKSSAETVYGSCEGVFPRECVDAITRQLRTGFGTRSSGRSFQCPDLSVTDPACKDVFEADKGGVSAVGTILPAGNPSDLTATGSFDYARVGLSGDHGGHALGNLTAYNEALQRVYLVGVAWGYSNVSGADRADRPEVEASFGCLRANQVAAGSQPLSAGGAMLSASSGSLLMELIVGAVVVLLVG
ncbi:hypothetical protein B0T14DRAFT_560318 [Immersiella caudata]|uniref:Uncharacterized protein n=1 Tax=Immersiella caudata TaxID=314043 RepID=A0AA39XET2_9PEZI|nr:hypothetical protein B0T14DRAFT_560318 [Immersiella caudata]